MTRAARRPVWLFDLDNTLHDASRAAFGMLDVSMNAYIERELQLPAPQADALRRDYWRRYGATMLGLVRHHGVDARHFLHHTHLLPGLEDHVEGHAHDKAALRRLPGRKYVLTNAPARYARRVLGALGLARCFDGVISIEQMRMFGQFRPKPDRRMFQALVARLRVPATRCVLVEDTLAHQKAARQLGMRTVWMQRYVRRSSHGPEVGVYLHRKPTYVHARIRSLQKLRRL
ncbi:pyrimidine 5'-nucleotidase [Caldimonas thermodepolymerans]|jgi:pyrimidine 5''-nucleotidase|uniref:Hydrolase of the HAD superfamily n=1 Tax=Caldimonas thermodepolymerans TaxID=215580 RepID=A0A2S5T203_9BURK|nr:pyrimidine 5'-nucleotidase [Caldimonas thermodepolymerans]PPE69003.1 pyrimidine 5'-nucleotidase [Caldimonas thermodepolymerans]QPC32303.1 pyrimidine 5'-nucleotidase [Caldimonas thermodepolymerans]RDH98199.1 putative hydrolase of the HAD superfamily [Caldimonas thermodepolymerans]TCP08024.1 putative hydrolase of the HAD superfamily [Caldimonas thermodepolymerans]UZG45103.1 pyrimidine 5'-nucleotidase [Caldimonas thermodepolymerans]